MEADDSVIANNVVYHQTNGFGIQVRSDAASGPDNVIVANNTISSVSMAGIVLEHTANNAKIINNVSAFNGGSGILGYFSTEDHPLDPVGTGNVAYNNLVYGNTRNLYSDPTPIGATILHFPGPDVVADPRFGDPLAADFHLRDQSPAIDRALAAFSPRIDHDFVSRPQRTAADIGAYELP
jgi:Right handed beta helix region